MEVLAETALRAVAARLAACGLMMAGDRSFTMRDIKFTKKGVDLISSELDYLCGLYAVPRELLQANWPFYHDRPDLRKMFFEFRERLEVDLGYRPATDVLDRIRDLLTSKRRYREEVKDYRDILIRTLSERAEVVRQSASNRINKEYSQWSVRKMEVSADVDWPSDTPSWNANGIRDITKFQDKCRVKLVLSVMQAMKISKHNVAFLFRGKPFFSLSQETITTEHLEKNDLLGYRLTGVCLLEGNALKRLIADTNRESKEMYECGDEESAEALSDLVRQYQNAQYNNMPVKFTAYVVRSKYARYAEQDYPISGEGFTLTEAMSLFQRRVKQETYKTL